MSQIKNKIIEVQNEFKISYIGMAEMCEIAPRTYAIKKMNDSGREFTQLELDRLKKNFKNKFNKVVCK